MNKEEISDKRQQNVFKGITFSKYKKSAVKKELLNNLSKGKVEPACYWSAEYICAGHFADLWEVILLFASKNIHLGNPSLPLYIEMRYRVFKEIVLNGYIGNELQMRNNPKIRRLFAEMISILCLSMKKHPYATVRIEKKEFQSTELTDRLKAPDISFAQQVFTKDDPNELFIAVNEFAYHVSETSRNASLACYWIEWILEFEGMCRREKRRKYEGARRGFAPVETKHQCDIVWIIWNVILTEAIKKRNGSLKIIKALLSIFSIRFSPGVKRRRRFIMYFAVSLLTEKFDRKIQLYKSPEVIENIKSKIDIIYMQVKKNEEKPDTDYLFNNSIAGDGSNLKKTIAKLDRMNAIVGHIPRAT